MSEEVNENEGKALAKEINAIFMKTSAKLNTSINEMFNNIGKKFLSEIILNEFATEENFKVLDKNLGEGTYGKVKEIKLLSNGKICAAKLLLNETKNDDNECKLIEGFKGPGIVKVTKVSEQNYNNKNYNLIIMEKALLKSLYKFFNKLYKDNLLDLIFKSPFEFGGDNLLRFFIKNIVKGMEVLDRYNYSHYDIKPQNILIFLENIAKLADFGMLRNHDKLKKEEKDKTNKYKVPPGTPGYVPPEFFQYDGMLDKESAIKYDYFSLGATIYFMKFGENLLEYQYYEHHNKLEKIKNKEDIKKIESETNKTKADIIITELEKKMDKIKSKQSQDKDFIEFLCGLIQYKSKNRPYFEEIYRNKWLNKNSEEIEEIFDINNLDEKKLLIELEKSDFLLSKKKNIKKINKENNDEKNIKKINRHKFVFNKKILTHDIFFKNKK